MQVKKFEAKTMKDALQLVKQELGPDAIILSAKDNKRSFGLAGKGSVEITAAISEKSLQKKKYVERNLPENAKERFRGQSAKRQKEFIEDAVTKLQNRQTPLGAAVNARIAAMSGGTGAMSRRPMTTQRYIDIGEDEPTHQTPEQPMKGRRVDDILKEFMKGQEFVEPRGERSVEPRGERYVEPREPQTQPRSSMVSHAPAPSAGAQEEVLSLRKEVESLRELLNQFGKEKTGSRHPGAEYGLPFEMSASFEKLQNAGVDIRYAVEILEKANEELNPMEKKRLGMVDAWVARYILTHTSVVGQWIKPSAKIHLFVGPGGHGKTTALVKMAGEMVLGQKKKIAVVSTDTFKVGAVDQLRIYCQILALPFEAVKTTDEMARVLQKYAAYDAVLIDYPGLSLKDMNEIDQVRALIPDRTFPKQTHLVLSCVSKDADAYEICHRYQVTHFDDILVTKVDESFVHGFLYNVQRKTEKPLYAFGLGQKIPEDIELATRERVIDLIFKITKNKK